MRNLIILISYFTLKVEAYSTILEAQLRTELYTTNQYEVKSRPSANTAITLTFMPTSLNELNIKDETMTMTGYYTASWVDSRLVWNTIAKYSGIDSIYSTSLETWRPLFIILNSVSGVSIINDDYNLMRVQDTGRIMWTQPFVLKTYCSCDITYYPFDTQTCAIVLSTWSYSQIEVDLKFHAAEVLTSFFQENGEWKFISYETSITRENRDGRAYALSNVFLTFQRRPQFIVMNTIIPMMFLAFMSCLTFYVSIDSGEKIGYCLTVMLAYAVYLTIVSDTMPTTSVKTSILSVYLVFGLALDIISVPISLFIIKCYHRDENTPIPKSVRGVTSCFQRMLCETKPKCFQNRPKSTAVEDINVENHDGVNMVFYSQNQEEIKMKLQDDETLKWCDVCRIWDAFFLRLYLVVVTLATVGLLAFLLYNYHS